MGTQGPPQRTSPIFCPCLLWLNGRTDQDATWYGVGLGTGDIMLDREAAEHRPQLFGPCLLWPNGWTDQANTWYGDRPQPRRHCVRWEPISRSPKGAQQPSPSFRLMSIVAKRSPISATAELLMFFLYVRHAFERWNLCYRLRQQNVRMWKRVEQVEVCLCTRV